MKKTECEKYICESIYDFISEKWDKIDKERCELEKVTKTKFLKEIKSDFETAMWVITEVMSWGMGKNIYKEMIDYEDPDGKFVVFSLGGKYIKSIWNDDYTHTVSFAVPKTKTITYFD